MAPFSRFQVSPYKNALPTPSPPTAHYFPQSSSAHPPAAIAACHDWILVASGSDVLAVGWDEQGKSGAFERRAWSGGVGELTALVVQDDCWVAVVGRAGIAVFALPDASFAAPELLLTLPAAPSISAHPTTPSLLLSHLSVYTVNSDKPRIVLESWADKGVGSTCWSSDGRFVCGVAKDGSVGVWEPRKSTAVQGSSAVVLNPLKPSSCTPFGTHFLVTGFSKTRERIVLVFDPLKPTVPVSSSVLDYETSALLPLADASRNLVYLLGKGDTTLKTSELNRTTSALTPWSTIGLGAGVAAAALAPWTRLDVIQGEVNRVLVLSKAGEVRPVPVVVPQRHYIDFNETVHPPARTFDGAQTADAWLNGSDEQPRLVSRDPSLRETRKTKPASNGALLSTPAATSASAALATPATATVPSPAPKQASSSAAPAAPSAECAVPATPSSPAPAPTPPATLAKAEVSPPVQEVPFPAPTPSQPSPAAATGLLKPQPSKPLAAASKPPAPAPRWSRNFLAGSTPLIPAHDNLDYVSSSYPAEFPLLLATAKLLVFPIAGPGGRIAVHPREARGRMPLVGDVKALEVGTELVDIALDPAEEDGRTRIVTAGKDGKVKVWAVPSAGLEEGLHEPSLVVDTPSLDKVAKLAFSPTVKHMLAIASNDFGEGVLRIVDTQDGTTVLKQTVNEAGVFSAAWSRSGTQLAVAGKDKRVYILNPRSPDKTFSAAAHDSPRSFALEWVSDEYLITVGHSTGSMRKLHLYALADGEMNLVGQLGLDVSPALLVPHFDPDTALLFLWSKGSSNILAFDVDPANKRQPFVPLPPFTAGALQNGLAFLPKTEVDVRAVEVAHALRLTTREIQEVSWKVPRRFKDRFQDDVYPATQGPPSGTVEDWLAGRVVEVPLIDLQPSGMEPLSTMPKAETSTIREKPKAAVRELTTAERAEQSMNLLFEKAKLDADSDEEERIKGDEEWSD